MTSNELLDKMKNTNKNTEKYLAQFNNGLEFNKSDLFSRLIKDAARCNGYNSDVYYDLCYIDTRMKEFFPADGFEPIWIGFRKMGVDCTSFVLCRCNDEHTYGSIEQNYFALYSITVDEVDHNFYSVELTEYNV